MLCVNALRGSFLPSSSSLPPRRWSSSCCEPEMPLILAIEPDRYQAAQLAGIIRRRVQAELVLADTTERALDAIGQRVPDLVLVPPLLSPRTMPRSRRPSGSSRPLRTYRR